MSNDEYSNVTEETFESYRNLDPLPTCPIDATQYQISVAKDTDKKQLEMFKEQCFAEISLNRKLINYFNKTHLIHIKKNHIGHNNFSMPNIVKHLWKRNGKVTDTGLLSNKETMSKHCDPEGQSKPSTSKLKME